MKSRRHWPDVAAIYAEGIAAGHATFDAQPPMWADFDAGHLAGHLAGHGRVAVGEDGQVVGWVAVSAVSDRCIYGGRRILWSNARNRLCLKARHLA
jgi:L-amino acid N-acyltransferase YncA